MPRRMRSLSKSKIYHVMVRGNERKNIFLDEDDKVRYMGILSRLTGYTMDGTENTSARSHVCIQHREKVFYIYAYCLMDNHVHLLINEGEDEISRIMKRIGTSYAYYFNKKYGRVGHLFQDRFKSEPVEDDGYLLAVARYIHNNPVKAGMVKDASSYLWSSFNMYITEDSDREFVARDTILDILSTDRKKAVKLFIDYSEQENRDEFIDYVKMQEAKTILNFRDASKFVQSFLKDKRIDLSILNDKENIGIRNELISRLRKSSNLSIREIAELLKINRGVIQRIDS